MSVLFYVSLSCVLFSLYLKNCLDVPNQTLHLTRTCPQNKREMIERGSAINCSENYMCLPNKNLTELFEICIPLYSIITRKGKVKNGNKERKKERKIDR